MSRRIPAAMIAFLACAAAARTQAPAWSGETELSRWSLDHDLVRSAAEAGPASRTTALRLRAIGADPYLSSPAFEYRSEKPPEVEIVLSVGAGGTAQLFWTEDASRGFREDASARFETEVGRTVAYIVPLKGVEPWRLKIARLRLDPGSSAGDVEVVSVTLRTQIEAELRRDPTDSTRLILTAEFEAPTTAPFTDFKVVVDDTLRAVETDTPQILAGRLKAGERRSLRVLFAPTSDGVHVADLHVGARRVRLAAGTHAPEGTRFWVIDWPLWTEGLILELGNGKPHVVKFDPVAYAPMSSNPSIEQVERTARIPGGGRIRLRQSYEVVDAPGSFDADEYRLAQELRADVDIAVLDWTPALWTRTDYWKPLRLDKAPHGGIVFPGIEMLDSRERSSSDRSDRTSARHRRITDPISWTRPWISHGDHGYLRWTGGVAVSPLFDAPDTLFGSDHAVIGLVFPRVGEGRRANALVADVPFVLKAGTSLFVAYAFSDSDHYHEPSGRVIAAPEGMPSFPTTPVAAESRRAFDPAPTVARAVVLAPKAYLDSSLYDAAAHGFGHCVEATWPRSPSADLPAVMLRLLLDHPEIDRADALRSRAHDVLAHVPAALRLHGGKAHARVRAAPFLTGGLGEALDGFAVPAWVGDPAAVEKRVTCEGPLAESHWEKTASGLVAAAALEALEAAAFTGDKTAMRVGLALVERFDGFEVPRGAQTWEVPLHAPDILAASHAVQAATLAFEFTGDNRHLMRARSWFLRGLPFVYDHAPCEGRIGLGATIAVLGATNYTAPNWIGLPVQWCGLGYAEALYRYARRETWSSYRAKALETADQIFRSAVDQLADDGEAVGCLPDSFVLRAQRGQGPWINPGSVHALLPDFERRPPLTDLFRWPKRGAIVHAPGALKFESEDDRGFTVSFAAPRDGVRYDLVVIDCDPPAVVEVAPVDGPPDGRAHTYDADRRRLHLTVRGSAKIRLAFEPR